jgi:hypothetical protein
LDDDQRREHGPIALRERKCVSDHERERRSRERSNDEPQFGTILRRCVHHDHAPQLVCEPPPGRRFEQNASDMDVSFSATAVGGIIAAAGYQYGQLQLQQRPAFRGPDRGLRAALRRLRLVEHHHLRDEGLHVAYVRQAAGSRSGAKIFGRIAGVIGLVIILREQLQ